jgi:hypothetical protein
MNTGAGGAALLGRDDLSSGASHTEHPHGCFSSTARV